MWIDFDFVAKLAQSIQRGVADICGYKDSDLSVCHREDTAILRTMHPAVWPERLAIAKTNTSIANRNILHSIHADVAISCAQADFFLTRKYGVLLCD